MIDTKPTESSATHTGETNQPRWLLCTLLAAAAATVVVVAVAFVTGGEADVEPDMVDELAVDPAAVIENYRIAYNSGDIDRVMALSSDESVVTDHPIVSRAAGLTAIRNVQLRDIDQAASVDAYTMFNVEVRATR